MRFLLAAFIAAIPSFACSMVCTNTEVGPSFRVKVENQKSPVKGLRLIITGERFSRSAETDKYGFASFAGAPAGTYSLRAAQDAGFGYGCLLVKLDHSSAETVHYSWPTEAPITVKSLRGVLYSSNFRPPKPDGERSLELIEAISGRHLKSIQTDKAGEFDFAYSAPGLYFIGIKHMNDESTELVAVTITPEASADHLEIDYAWTSCGLVYVDQSKCPRITISAARLFGSIADQTGAAIAKGYVWVQDRDGKTIEELRSDNEGNFTSTVTSPGLYQLITGLPGLPAPLRATIQLDPSAPYAALRLNVGGFSGCSTVSTQ